MRIVNINKYWWWWWCSWEWAVVPALGRGKYDRREKESDVVSDGDLNAPRTRFPCPQPDRRDRWMQREILRRGHSSITFSRGRMLVRRGHIITPLSGKCGRARKAGVCANIYRVGAFTAVTPAGDSEERKTNPSIHHSCSSPYTASTIPAIHSPSFPPLPALM